MENRTYNTYGIKVNRDDPRYPAFLEEMKNGDEEGELHGLHEDWCGVQGLLIGDDVIVSYACNYGTQQEIMQSLLDESSDYVGVILEFLGSNYRESQFQFFTIEETI